VRTGVDGRVRVLGPRGRSVEAFVHDRISIARRRIIVEGRIRVLRAAAVAEAFDNVAVRLDVQVVRSVSLFGLFTTRTAAVSVAEFARHFGLLSAQVGARFARVFDDLVRATAVDEAESDQYRDQQQDDE